MKVLIRFLIALAGGIFFFGGSTFGQYVTITGNTSVTQNTNAVYYASWSPYEPSSYIEWNWYPQGNNSLTSHHASSATVFWVDVGTHYLEYELITWDNYYWDNLAVTVTGSGPATPSTGFTFQSNCGNTLVTRNSSPPSTADWYWQTSFSGTSTSLGYLSSITRTATGPLYLRARLKVSPYTWSSTSLNVGTFNVNPAVTAAPSVQHASRCGEGLVTLSGTPEPNANTLRWYTASEGGTYVSPDGLSRTESISPPGKTYYVSSYNSSTFCESNSRTAVTATVTVPSTAEVVIAGPGPICANQVGNATFHVIDLVNGGTNPTYTWYRGFSGTTLAEDNQSSTPETYYPSNDVQHGEIIRCHVTPSAYCTNADYSNSVTVQIQQPATPIVYIHGQTQMCKSSPSTFTASSPQTITSYAWSIGESTTLSNLSSFTPTTTDLTSWGGEIRLTVGVTGCVGTASSSLTVQVYEPVGAAGNISGPGIVCPGQSGVVYYVTPITNANPHVWTFPTGMTPVPGSTSSNVTVNIESGFTGGNLTVHGENGPCTAGPSSTIPVSLLDFPPALGSISESTTACPGKTGVVYSVTAVSGIDYVWSVPPAAAIVSGANTNSITVNYANQPVEGSVGVYGLNCRGNGQASTRPVTVTPIPEAADAISGSTNVCPAQTGVSYSVPVIDNATSYHWTVPPGGTISSPSNSNSITVDFSLQALSGSITVYASNCSGDGASSTFHVGVNPLPGSAGQISGNTLVCPGASGIVYNVPPISNASGYLWTVPTGATIVSGQGSTSIVVDFTATSFTGTVKVRGTNCGLTGPESSLIINYTGRAGADRVNHSVDLVTGTLSAGLPLFAVQAGDITVPISLAYSATGVRVTDDDGWLGHNWNVSCQSYGIFREMRGLPDDYLVTNPPGEPNPDNRKGWLNSTIKTSIKNFTPSTDDNPSTCSDEASNFTFLDGISYEEDTEPDAFRVALPGLSFDFFFDENNVAQVVPYTDVLITPNTTTGPISSFTVVDAQGIEYQFNETESLTEKMFETSPYYFVRRSHQHVREFTYNTSWRLTKITSPTHGIIDITYLTIATESDDLVPDHYYYRTRHFQLQYKYHYPLITSNTHGATGTMRYSRSSVMKLPHMIISPDMEAEFVSVEKYPGQPMKRLEAINLYDKRESSLQLVKTADLAYSLLGPQDRAFLTNLKLKIACIETNYGFEYNILPELPLYTSGNKDEWDLYKIHAFDAASPQYDETVASGSLRKIIHPLKGYSVFFYEVHDFWNGTTDVRGGGIRIKKIIEYDGVSSANDAVQEYTYKAANGNSSGKLQHRNALSFSVAKHQFSSSSSDVYRYHEQQVMYPWQPTATINEKFTVTGDQDLSRSNHLAGSAVAYERVIVKTNDAGYNIFEYDLPASFGETTANDNEWVASKVLIARPASGSATCFEKPNIEEGYHRYPFPVNPPYNFARGRLRKVTAYSETDVKVRDVVYDYETIYKDAEPRKVYGLAMEELPTYYYTGTSYVDNKMFLYSKYELMTDVKLELTKQIETVYSSGDLSKKTEVETNYYFDSPNHRLLSRTVRKNSDGTETISRMKYVHDFSITTPTDAASTALKALNDAHRGAIPVEIISSKLAAGVEETIGASITLFQTLSSKIYPHRIYRFHSNDGTDSFTPASVEQGAVFTFDDDRYVLQKTFHSFDSYGNPITTSDGNRVINSAAYGYNGTLPVISLSNAGIDEVKYSDFEAATSADFDITWGSPAYGSGFHSSKALIIPAGSETSHVLTNGITYNRSPWYIFSCWVKATTSGTLSVQVGASASSIFTYNISPTSEWSYCRLRVPVGSIVGTSTSFYIKVWSSVEAHVDDVAFHPEQSDFTITNYQLPFGKIAEKDSRGNYLYYDYDPWGRLEAVFDRDRNVLKTYDYQIKP